MLFEFNNDGCIFNLEDLFELNNDDGIFDFKALFELSDDNGKFEVEVDLFEFDNNGGTKIQLVDLLLNFDECEFHYDKTSLYHHLHTQLHIINV